MYTKYYNLTGLPFQLTPDSQFFFGSTGHRRALAHLVYGLEQQEGFIVITGEVGAGKTTLVELLWSQLDHGAYTIARVMTTLVTADDLLRLVARGFAIDPTGEKSMVLQRIEDRLRSLRAQGRRALLVVDEVQGLSLAGLEELRMVSNISDQGRSLLQIILLGQPEFRRTLGRAELNQLRQRVLASYHLGPLSVDETRAYIEHRLTTVGWAGRPQWETAAFAQVHHHTGGIPRRINRLCSRVLLHAALEESAIITAASVDNTATELDADIGAEPAEVAPAQAVELTGRIEALQGRLDRLFELLGSNGRAP
jgi:putative secretion ATPase (PEP-CTERM system associated)